MILQLLPCIMDFNIKKPSHIFALLLIISSFFIIIISPMLSFFGVSSIESTDTQEVENLSGNAKILFEILLVVFGLIFVFILMVLFPVLWYFIVNKSSIKEILSRFMLTLKGVDKAILWGVLVTIIMFAISYIIIIISLMLKANSEELGNIQDIDLYLSPISMLILVSVQPMAEEVFFRGFLFDKVRSHGGDYLAVALTSVLFGIAHMSYSKPDVVISTIIMGFVLAVIVLKTKNLLTAIIAHTLFNFTTLMLYIIATY